jgi:hypothetical protein
MVAEAVSAVFVRNQIFLTSGNFNCRRTSPPPFAPVWDPLLIAAQQLIKEL